MPTGAAGGNFGHPGIVFGCLVWTAKTSCPFFLPGLALVIGANVDPRKSAAGQMRETVGIVFDCLLRGANGNRPFSLL